MHKIHVFKSSTGIYSRSQMQLLVAFPIKLWIHTSGTPVFLGQLQVYPMWLWKTSAKMLRYVWIRQNRIECVFIYRTYHLSSHGGLQFLSDLQMIKTKNGIGFIHWSLNKGFSTWLLAVGICFLSSFILKSIWPIQLDMLGIFKSPLKWNKYFE